MKRERMGKGPLFRFCVWVCGRFAGTKPEKRIRRKLREPLEQLYPLAQTEKLLPAWYAKRLYLVLMVLLCGLMFAGIAAVLQKQDQQPQTVHTLPRSTYGNAASTYTLQAAIGDNSTPEPVRIDVLPRIYTQEELETVFSDCKERLEQLILGENASLSEVTDDLRLVESIPDTGVSVWWQVDRMDVMHADGTLQKEALTPAGTIVELTAHLCAQEKEEIETFYVHVKKPLLSEEEARKEALAESINAANQEGQTKAELTLPAYVDGEPVAYTTGEQQTAAWKLLLVFTPIAAVLVLYGKKADMKKELKARSRQMQLDYPEIVSKLILLFTAGLTVREAWGRIVQGYLRACEQGKERRYAYEEMVAAYREMQGGMTELEAYDRFARHCGQGAYLKLGSLLVQNIRKGTRTLIEMLSYESVQAMEERKSTAKQMGEEAGTKLLVPMVMMLLVVILILIVPAFLSMRG